MLTGACPFYVEIGDLPSGDPIIGDYRFKFGVSGGKALADTIDRVGRMDAQALAALRAEARDYAETYLRAPSTEAMRQMTHASPRLMTRRSYTGRDLRGSFPPKTALLSSAASSTALPRRPFRAGA